MGDTCAFFYSVGTVAVFNDALNKTVRKPFTILLQFFLYFLSPLPKIAVYSNHSTVGFASGRSFVIVLMQVVFWTPLCLASRAFPANTSLVGARSESRTIHLSHLILLLTITSLHFCWPDLRYSIYLKWYVDTECSASSIAICVGICQSLC